MALDNPIPEAVTAVEIDYQVHIRSNGSKACHWPEGTWFQTGSLMGDFASVDEARAALTAFRVAGRGEYRHLPLRIVQVTSVATVVHVD